jgi:hypothetical protein
MTLVWTTQTAPKQLTIHFVQATNVNVSVATLQIRKKTIPVSQVSTICNNLAVHAAVYPAA